VPTARTDLELKLYGALHRIARDYQSASRLIRHGDCGLSGPEALEMAYENIQQEAENAIRGIRRKRPGDRTARVPHLIGNET
jgi:hypothetical protein